MKKLLQSFLAYLSRAILKKYLPVVIGITGSVGKTSAKEAIFSVVSQKYFSRKSEKNFNNEFGLPLTIVGFKQAPGKNPLNWFWVFVRALNLIFVRQKYPEILVLEMGIDRAGDMDYLLSIARPHIGIITSIGVSHLEYLKDLVTIKDEKGKLAEVLKSDDFLAINADNQEALGQKCKTIAKVLTYGLQTPANIRLVNIQEKLENHYFTAFTVQADSRRFDAFIKAVGETHLSSVAAACAAAEALGIETDLVVQGLREYKPAPGRLNIVAGIKNSVIIDDTYNAAPDSAKIALNLLSRMPGGEKTAALGEMLELGSISEQSHREIGRLVAALKINKLVTVGAGGKTIARGAREAGMGPEHILSFDTSADAQRTVKEILKPTSVILVKGSQGMRMEKITKEIMAEPMRAKELLCRQDGYWLK